VPWRKSKLTNPWQKALKGGNKCKKRKGSNSLLPIFGILIGWWTKVQTF
jgi:hypothetical protein